MVVQVPYKFISSSNIAKLCSLLGVGSFNSCQLSFFDTLSSSAKTNFGFLFQELMYWFVTISSLIQDYTNNDFTVKIVELVLNLFYQMAYITILLCKRQAVNSSCLMIVSLLFCIVNQHHCLKKISNNRCSSQ